MATIQKKSVSRGQFLDNQFVDTAIRTYKQEKWVHNSARISKEDSLTCWTSLAELERLSESIKKHRGNGIRICFGAYPPDYAVDSELAGRQTVILIATKTGEDATSHKDLYISHGKNAQVLAFGGLPHCPRVCGGYFNASPSRRLGQALVDEGENGLSVI